MVASVWPRSNRKLAEHSQAIEASSNEDTEARRQQTSELRATTREIQAQLGFASFDLGSRQVDKWKAEKKIV